MIQPPNPQSPEMRDFGVAALTWKMTTEVYKRHYRAIAGLYGRSDTTANWFYMVGRRDERTKVLGVLEGLLKYHSNPSELQKQLQAACRKYMRAVRS